MSVQAVATFFIKINLDDGDCFRFFLMCHIECFQGKMIQVDLLQSYLYPVIVT